MEVGKTYKLYIEGYDMNGAGVAKSENIIVFVSRALKDETVLAKITNLHKHYAFAELVKVIDSSKDRIVSPCPYYEGCGGCDLLHLKYKVECQIKEDKVKNAFLKINQLCDFKMNPLISNQKITGYRNKIMLPFGYDEDQNVIYGFYEKMSHNIISIDWCEISNYYVNQVVEFIRKYLSVMHISIYDEEKNTGIFRGLMVRNNYQNEMMVVLIVTKR
ncbi:MAG: TRAM domain-containing protein, partial [Anaeroplasmataceae bacterium]|nr:TRAM domain-containing protein [Anaeroplasmataceae bacterium]